MFFTGKKKRIPALALAVLLLVSVFSGCKAGEEKESSSSSGAGAEPLRILLDVEYYGGRDPTLKSTLRYFPTEKDSQSFEEALEKACGVTDILLEYLPDMGEEREIALVQLRTEIMAGGGPDVYICPAQNDYQVFPYPDSAMEKGSFLNLDPYLSKAQFLNLENMPAVLAEAGQYEGSQYVIPLAFTLPVTLFRETEVQHELSETMTWGDMAAGDLPLKIAAANSYRQVSMSDALRQASPLLPMVKDGQLTFSEQELLDFIVQEEELGWQIKDDPDFPDCDPDILAVNLFTDLILRPQAESLKGTTRFTMIPTYSLKGGYGALINSFAAVNAGTERPEDAFAVVDFLMSDECLRSDIFQQFICSHGVPAVNGVEIPLKGNGEAYEALRNNLCFAEFNTPVVSVASDLMANVRSKTTGMENPELYNKNRKIETVRNIESKTTEELVHEAYTKMKMMLDES